MGNCLQGSRRTPNYNQSGHPVSVVFIADKTPFSHITLLFRKRKSIV